MCLSVCLPVCLTVVSVSRSLSPCIHFSLSISLSLSLFAFLCRCPRQQHSDANTNTNINININVTINIHITVNMNTNMNSNVNMNTTTDGREHEHEYKHKCEHEQYQINATVVSEGGTRVDSVPSEREALTSGAYRQGFCYCEGILPAGTYTVIISTYKPGQVFTVLFISCRFADTTYFMRYSSSFAFSVSSHIHTSNPWKRYHFNGE